MIILMLSLACLHEQLQLYADDNNLTDAQADELADYLEARAGDARLRGIELN